MQCGTHATVMNVCHGIVNVDRREFMPVQDYKDGSHSQVTASAMDTKWRDDFERMKKARVHRCVWT